MPQPVDFQTEMGKVTAAERIQQIADRASLAAQQRTSEDAEIDRVTAEKQVKETLESEGEQSQKTDAEAHRKNPFLGRRKKRDKRTKDSANVFYSADEKEQVVEEEGQDFDISV